MDPESQCKINFWFQSLRPVNLNYLFEYFGSQKENKNKCVLSEMIFFLTWGTIFVECALGDPREDGDHRVSPVLLVQVGEPEYVGAIVKESTTQKAVHEKDVADHVEKVHELQLPIWESIKECQLAKQAREEALVGERRLLGG
jgi:hypothetical protein